MKLLVYLFSTFKSLELVNKSKVDKIFESKLKLNPNFITGLTESEGSFSIIKHKDIRAKFKINISLRFKITMLNNEVELLNMIKYFFNCGFILHNKDGSIDFTIRDINSINSILMPNFLNYPLRGTKYLDFLSFKEAINIINYKEHLTEKGINKLINISENMNTFIKYPLLYSPLHTIEGDSNYIPLNGYFINGFIVGDGCLALSLKNKNFGRMSLQITQHINNKLLLVSIANYFKSLSKVYPHGPKSLQLTLSGIKVWENVVFNHFCLYPLYGSKS